MVLMLRQFCCCCTLKTGTIIIGVLTALTGVLCHIGGITLAAAAAEGHYVNENNKTDFVAVISVFAVLGAIMLLVAICLIIGAIKGISVLLVPWMVYTLVQLTGILILFFLYISSYFTEGVVVGAEGGITVTIIYILTGTYFVLVVYSLYREMKGTAPPNLV